MVRPITSANGTNGTNGFGRRGIVGLVPPQAPVIDPAGRAADKVQTQVDDPLVPRKGSGRHGIVAFEVAAGEMQTDDLAGFQTEQRRTGIAAECRTIMRRRRNHLAEAVGIASALQLAGLQPLRLETIPEQV